MAPGIRDILYYMVHIEEFRAIIQWKVWHEPVHQRDESKESQTLQTCFKLLNQTSRSFSAVIQELHPELLVPVALFYLIERGLDTLEDDMTLSLEKKEPLLRTFDSIIKKPGWNFNESGPNEGDRELLVQFQNVIEEFAKIKFAYQEIIEDITRKMGNGMADYAKTAEFNANGVESVKDYDLYCYYVAGIVGEGCTRLFVESKLANPALLDRPQLHESMGLFLQKINIIRDIREDFDDKRTFWPKAIWSKHVDKFEDLLKPENKVAALNCSSEMTLNAMGHIPDCLYYLAGLKEQSVFNFCAIPQVMAISTLALVFRNPALFQRNVKISKGEACRNMVDATQNLRLVCEVFRKYTRKIHKKNTPRDPNFLKISIACGKVEQFIESIFPSQSPNAIIQQQTLAPAASLPDTRTPEERKKAEEDKWDTIYMMVAVVGSMFILSTIMIGVAWLAGARFDLAFEQLKQGRLLRPDPLDAQKIAKQYDHQEL